MNPSKESFKIAKILASLFTQASTLEEEKAYRDWIDKDPEHQKIAERILNQETFEGNTRLTKNFSSQKAWEKIYPLLGKGKASGPFFRNTGLKYAAIILLLLAPASYLIYHWAVGEPISEITPGTQGGEVILSDGNTFRISDRSRPEGMPKTFIIDSKGINYHTPANRPQVKETRNTLRTLQGMECHLTLSDGTKVHLNAETQITYPVCFNSKERVVEIRGEAYFDVAPDKEHPFIVQTPGLAVRVTGTAFNVRAYADEPTESVTLVQGSVQINHPQEMIELIPNQHFILDKTSKVTSLATVNTELYTSWESGSFIFKNIHLKDVMSYLSKWYGFSYTFEDEKAGNIQIGASLNRYQNMNPIIDMMQELNRVEIRQKGGILHISSKP